ncbi:mucoidy inhibitor MuiA family protein [Candidatus Omnitrophota bacterium]
MRTITRICLVLFLALNVSVCFAEVVETDSKIAQVTVYPGSALIARVANLDLSAGEHKIVFPEIIPEVDQNSLSVSGKGSAEVKIYGAQIKREYLEKAPSEQVKDLQAQILAIDDQINSLNNRFGVLNEEREFLNSIKLSAGTQIPKDLITKFPTVTELDSLATFLSTKLQENQSAKEAIGLKIRELNDKRNALNRQLQEINVGVRKMQRSIVVELEATKAGSLDLTISYLVRGVSWGPIYDARASFEKNNVELIMYGSIRQTTGEPWEDVELILSTAKPSIGGKMQELHPWFLRPYEVRKRRSGMLGAKSGNMRMEMDYVGTQTMMAPGIGGADDEGYMLAEEPEKATIAFAQAEEKGTAVVYAVTRKATIKSDGTDHKVPISSQDLSAKFEYAATPKLSSYAYLMSKVKNSKEGNLLPGRVNIFLEGDFVGISSIPKAIGAEEEFDLYLGIDEGITVKRKKLKEKTDETLIAGLPSRTRAITFEYKLIVENYKSKKIKVNLYDQIPVSENEKIVVKKVKFSQEPTIKDYLDRKGVMRWEFELKPKKTKEITLSYTIEHPRSLNVQGL